MGESRQSKRAKRASAPPPERGASPAVASLASADADSHASHGRRAASEEIHTEAAGDFEAEDDGMCELPPSEKRNGTSSASIYAPSRFPGRLEPRPKFTVVGDSIMEEGSIDL